MHRPKRISITLSTLGAARLVDYMQRAGVKAHVRCELGCNGACSLQDAVTNIADALAEMHRAKP